MDQSIIRALKKSFHVLNNSLLSLEWVEAVVVSAFMDIACLQGSDLANISVLKLIHSSCYEKHIIKVNIKLST